jgi:hypothetical protein
LAELLPERGPNRMHERYAVQGSGLSQS